jgi:hypothetical protein
MGIITQSRKAELKAKLLADTKRKNFLDAAALARSRGEEVSDDKLLRYAVLIINDALEGKLTHDPAVAMQALMHLTGVTAGLWNEYQTLLRAELHGVSLTQRRQHLRAARAKANEMAAKVVNK